MKKRLAAVVTVFAMLVAMLPTYGIQACADGSADLKVEYHSVEQIKDFVSRYPAALNQSVTYEQEPSVKSPYNAGEISDETAQSALNLLNQIRYIAGVPANVTLDSNYAGYAQAAALVNAANNKLSHAPEMPSDMSEALYTQGKTGAARSNIAWNYGTLNKAILEGWLDDSSSSNISTVGHRSWMLNPTMAKTGFGVAGRFYSMYVIDGVSALSSYKNIAWPAQNTPVEYFSSNQPWSVLTGFTLDASKIQITVKKNSDGTVWNFSQDKSDGEFYVTNNIYGMKGGIIFRPAQITTNSGDSFDIKITGAGDDISYTVNFFTLGAATANTSSSTTATTASSTTSSTAASTTASTTNSTTSSTTVASTSGSTSASATTIAAEKQYVEITGTNVNTRAGAGTNYKFITTVNKGQRYKFTATKIVDGNKWYKISVNGKTCWVIGTYATEVESGTTTTTVASSTTPAAGNYVEITGNLVNVRAGAGTNYKRITIVKQGQRYKFSSTKTVDGSKWYKISVNGKACWIIGTYVKEVDSAVTTTTTEATTTTSTTASQSTTSTKASEALSSATTTTTTVAPAGNYVEITGNLVNVRAGAGTNYKRITIVKQGQRYKFSSTKTVDGSKWYKISVNGKTCWIIGTYVKEVDSAVTTTTTEATTTTSTTASQSTTSTKASEALSSATTTTTTVAPAGNYVEITGNLVNVRAGAGTNYKRITIVKQGQRYKFSSTKTVDGSKWYKISVNGKACWIIGTYVKEVDSAVTTTTTKATTTTSTTASTSATTTTKATTTTAAPNTHVEITGRSVYVRAGAGTNNKIVSAVKRGENYKFTATKTVNGVKWYKITVKGVTGWVIGTYAKEYAVATTTTNKTTTTTTVAAKTYVIVTGTVVNVRSGAGTNYSLVTSVKKNQQLVYTSVKTVSGKKWYKVTVGSKTGWIVGTYVKVVSTATTTKKTTTTTKAAASYVTITGSTVNVRSSAGTGYNIVTKVAKSQKFKYSATKKVNGTTWYKITANGKTGWVVGTYVKAS